VDLTASALVQAAGHGVRAVRADVARLPLPDESVDVVSAGEILEHVTDLDGCVAEACRVLRPGGRLVLDTVAATPFARFAAVTVGEGIGAAPRGLHDPALLVDRRRLVAVAARHGVALRLRGIRPAVPDLARWFLRRRETVRMVPTGFTAFLIQGSGVKRGVDGVAVGARAGREGVGTVARW
jgi:2-polyprenyl-6-hydroxyphenyl methylase/3-demethylubiquinone-9 3-methyltransferase